MAMSRIKPALARYFMSLSVFKAMQCAAIKRLLSTQYERGTALYDTRAALERAFSRYRRVVNEYTAFKELDGGGLIPAALELKLKRVETARMHVNHMHERHVELVVGQ